METTIKLIEGYWTDDKLNKWSALLYTEKEARLHSASLENCRNCRNCRNCQGCQDCRDCWYCWYCQGCQDCWYCRDCQGCRNCRNCQGCQDCWYCQDCQDCQDCWYCRDCQDCQDCWYCRDCQDYTDNPLRFVGPRMGSRKDNPTVYWLGSNVQCVVGCFRGNLDELEIKVHETHAANPEHLKAYLQFIAVARNLIKETSTH